MYVTQTIGKILRTETFTIDGSSPTCITAFTDASLGLRHGVNACNLSSTRTTYFAYSNSSTVAPTLTSSDHDLPLAAVDHVPLHLDANVHLWAINDSGDATTSTVRVTEFK